MKFTAAILEQTNHPLVVREVELKDSLKPGQVLVKIERTAICGSQLGEIAAVKGPDKHLPHMLGHEAIAIVVDNGDSSKVSNGDQVILHWMKSSGRESEVPRYFVGGNQINAGNIATFGEFAVVSENRLTKVPHCKGLAMNILATIGCSFLTAFGTLQRIVGFENLSRVLITGGGGLGQSFVYLLRIMTESQITVLEPSPSRAEYCRYLSAQSVVEKVHDLTSLQPFSAVIETTGQVEVIQESFSLLGAPGVLALVGVSPTGSVICVDPMPLHYGKQIKGVYGGDAVPDVDIPQLLKILNLETATRDLKFVESTLGNINQLIEGLQDTSLVGRAIVVF